MMTSYLMGLAGFAVGVVFAAWRLKGDMTWRQAGKALLGGGGPGNEK
jgi:hypothetical protein